MERRHTWSRAELAQYAGFNEISPAPGELDAAALRHSTGSDSNALIAALVRLSKAADRPVARAVRRIAARVALRAAGEAVGRSGTGRRWVLERGASSGELDIDASLDMIVRSRAGRPAAGDELFFRTWRRPQIALCLLVDSSGSMSGSRLGSAALAAAVLAVRGGPDYSVIAVTDRAMILKGQASPRSVGAVVADLLALRSHGWTDLSVGLRAARAQLARSSCATRVTILLTDGGWNRGDDPLHAARALQTLHVIATNGRLGACRELAAAGHGRAVEIDGPTGIAGAIHALLAAPRG